jgi:hypothetical protein
VSQIKGRESQKRRQDVGATIATVPKEDDEQGVHVHPLSLTCLKARHIIRVGARFFSTLRPNDFPLPHRREVGRRRDGCRL